MAASTEFPRGWTTSSTAASGARGAIVIPAVANIAHVLTAINLTLYNFSGGATIFATQVLVVAAGVTLFIPSQLARCDATGQTSQINWTGTFPLPVGDDLTIETQGANPAGYYTYLDVAGYDI